MVSIPAPGNHSVVIAVSFTALRVTNILEIAKMPSHFSVLSQNESTSTGRWHDRAEKLHVFEAATTERWQALKKM